MNDAEDNWADKLVDDLQRINKMIDQVHKEVEESTATLRLLYEERERIVNESLES